MVWFKDKFDLVKELKKTKRKYNTLMNEFETVKEEQRVLQGKYIKLLEEKSEKFDLYIEYKDKCKALTDERRELKKEKAQLKEEVKELTDDR